MEIEVGPGWTRFPGSYAGLEGGDDSSQFPSVKREQLRTGGQWAWVCLPNRLGGAEE